LQIKAYVKANWTYYAWLVSCYSANLCETPVRNIIFNRIIACYKRENISVSFCLRAPGSGLTLWCAVGLLVGGAIQVPQLQSQLQMLTNVNGSVQSVTWMRKLCVSVWFIELQNNYNWNWNSKVNQNNSKESTWRIQTFLYQGKSGLDSRSGWPPKFNVDFLVQGLTSMIKFSWRSHQVFQKNVLSRNVEESFEKNFLMRIPMTYVI